MGWYLLIEKLKPAIEGLLFAVGEEGLSAQDLSSILDVSIEEVKKITNVLCEEMKSQGRGVQISQLADTYQMTTVPEHSHYFLKLVQMPKPALLSRAALETLAIIAYKQPITRVDVEEIRGVKSERIMQILHRKGLIKDIGRSNTLGRPILYATTPEFLNYFGLNSLEDLPSADSIFISHAIEDDKSHLFRQLGVKG